MAVNDLTFNQLATILNSITAQATGTANLTATDTSSFVTVGQTALKAGYDVLSTAISQVLSRTIFSVRPYTAKFKGMEVTEQQYGNFIRKLSVVDQPFLNDLSIDPTTIANNSTLDPFAIQGKPKVVQENYYGQNVYMKQLPLYDYQLDQAFSGPEQFASFVSMMMTNVSDMLEQARENTKRETLVNLIGAIIGNYTAQNYRLVTMYNAYLGLTGQNVVTWAGIKGNSTHYQRFMRFAYAKIAAVSAMMTERSANFHQSIGTDYIMRHSPMEDQRLYMIGQERYDMEAQVLADAYHDNYLRYSDVETVNFWQSINAPESINVTPSYLVVSGANAGTIAKGSAVNNTAVFAVLMDRDACGVTIANQRASTAYNARGFYTNYFFAETARYWNSFTENAAVFTLD